MAEQTHFSWGMISPDYIPLPTEEVFRWFEPLLASDTDQEGTAED